MIIDTLLHKSREDLLLKQTRPPPPQSFSTSVLFITQHVEPSNTVSISTHTHTQNQLHVPDRHPFIWSQLSTTSCLNTHAPSVHTEREHPSTTWRVPGSCVVKIYTTKRQTGKRQGLILLGQRETLSCC